MAGLTPDPSRIASFPDMEGFEAWLSANHGREPELWLKLFKKNSNVATITYAQAVETALCWGWIDGLRKGFDETAFLQRFTPRKSKSIWSQVNREHVARLIATGRMQPPGLAQVEAAKTDGRWDAAYAPSTRMELPDELLSAIAANPAAQAMLATLSKQNRYALGFRIGNLKTAQGRDRAIARYVEMLARGETFHPNGAGRKAKP